jgi:hypothetical protein
MLAKDHNVIAVLVEPADLYQTRRTPSSYDAVVGLTY